MKVSSVQRGSPDSKTVLTAAAAESGSKNLFEYLRIHKIKQDRQLGDQFLKKPFDLSFACSICPLSRWRVPLLSAVLIMIIHNILYKTSSKLQQVVLI